MREIFTIMDAKRMTRNTLARRLARCCEELESIGMEHDDACSFVSEVMNIGIAIQEKGEKNSEKYSLEK